MVPVSCYLSSGSASLTIHSPVSVYRDHTDLPSFPTRRSSDLGIPQLAAIMGMCVAGGAYLPVMCDHILMTEGSGLFLEVVAQDRKSTRLNSSHVEISYAVFCLKKKKKEKKLVILLLMNCSLKE